MRPAKAAALAAGLIGCSLSALPARADGPVLPHARAVLRGLDKITARISMIEVPVDQEVAFGTLRIVLRACLETPPTEPPESAAFLQIRVVDPDSASEDAFSGWMFASSPSLSALEHPVYDVWVIDCAEPLTPEPASPPPPGTALPPPSARPENE
jgi:hypothetical protein